METGDSESRRPRRKSRRFKRQATVKPEDYATYIRSPQWRAVRQRFIASKIPKICYGCRKPWGKGDHLHHRTYRTLGNERLMDLVPLCQGCHARVHRIYEERGLRGTVGLRRATLAVVGKTERAIGNEYRNAARERRPRWWETNETQIGEQQSTRSSRPTSSPRQSGRQCSTRTKAGKPCPISPRPSGLCHVHDPAVQCQAPTSRGPCSKPTGGGRCAAHR